MKIIPSFSFNKAMNLVIADAFDVLGKIIGSGFQNFFIESFNKLSYVGQVSSISGFYLMIYYIAIGFLSFFSHYLINLFSMNTIQNSNNLQMIQN
jgi:hypothetical protein